MTFAKVFADGTLIADSVKQVRAIRRSAEEQSIYGAPYRLEAPFPPIEVLRFRCKCSPEKLKASEINRDKQR